MLAVAADGKRFLPRAWSACMSTALSRLYAGRAGSEAAQDRRKKFESGGAKLALGACIHLCCNCHMFSHEQ